MANERDYLTKSELKLWVTCRRKYYYSYIQDIETEETEYMVRGSKIHELIEAYYDNVVEYAKNNKEPPTTMFSLLDDSVHEDWRDYLDPYLANFLGFERRRWQNADNMSGWVPEAIEEGMWEQVVDELPPFTGYADVLLPANSFNASDVEDEEGVVLVDFKTGEPKKEEYRDHENGGVYLDLSYYNMLFESAFDIRAIAGYYPKTDTLVVSSIQEERRNFVKGVAKEIDDADPDEISDYPLDKGPLCVWGDGEKERCEYYDRCPSNWGAPIDNQNRCIDLIKQGKSDQEIAEELETTKEAVRYWIQKKRWYRYR